jgi:site-specific recombinase XerC
LSLDTVQQTVASLTGQGNGLATLNRYIVAAKSFAAWLTRGKRCREDALKYLDKYRAETDRRLRRRALSSEDVARLVIAAESGPIIRGMGGTDRAMLYRLAVGTGFRVSELASLTPESFNLIADRPTVTVQAGHSKHRREDVQPLPR